MPTEQGALGSDAERHERLISREVFHGNMPAALGMRLPIVPECTGTRQRTES
jgi:hypothetical protein